MGSRRSAFLRLSCVAAVQLGCPLGGECICTFNTNLEKVPVFNMLLLNSHPEDRRRKSVMQEVVRRPDLVG